MLKDRLGQKLTRGNYIRLYDNFEDVSNLTGKIMATYSTLRAVEYLWIEVDQPRRSFINIDSVEKLTPMETTMYLLGCDQRMLV